MKKQKILLCSAGAIVLLVFIFYYALSYTCSRSYTISMLKNALLENDCKTAASLIRSSDKRLIINEKTIKSFFDYLNENPQNVQELVSTLYKQSAALNSKKNPDCRNCYLILKKSDTKFLGFSTYYFEMKPCFVDLNGDNISSDIYIDDKFVCACDKNNFTYTCGPYVQGRHKVTTVFKSSAGKPEDSKKLDFITIFGKDGKSYNYSCYVPLNDNFIRVTCNFDDAEIFVNGKNTGKTASDFKVFGPVNKGTSTVIYAEKKFPWGTLKSRNYEINSTEYNPLAINIGTVNEKVVNELRTAVAEYNKDILTPALKDRSTSFLASDGPASEKLKKEFDSLSLRGTYFSGNYLHSTISSNGISISYVAEKNTYFASIKSRDYYNQNYGQIENPAIMTSESGITNSYYAGYDSESKKWTIKKIYSGGA